MQEKINYEITTTLTKNKLFLYLLAIKYNLDIELLFVLEEELKEKLFFAIYLFAGSKTCLPPANSIAILNKHAEDIYQDKENDFKNCEENIQLLLNNVYDKDTGKLIIEAHKTNEKVAKLIKQKSRLLKLSIRKLRKDNESDNFRNEQEGFELIDDEGVIGDI